LILDQELIKQFIGGQAKILTERKACLYQGEISDITVTEYGMILQFSWLAKRDDLFSEKENWVMAKRKIHTAHLSFFEDKDKKKRAEFKKLPKDQLFLFSRVVEEVIVLLPPDYHNPLKLEAVVEKPLVNN
jgi:hypothetical protein